MDHNKNQYVLITGGSNGIGYELAKLFAKDGYNLILVSRTESDLDRVANELKSNYKIAVTTIAKDLFQKDAPAQLYEEVKQKGLTVEILVNDAGQGVYGRFIETDLQKQLDIIQLNINSLTSLTYLFLKDMVARNSGKILQLASVVSEVPSPLQAVYGGTKAFVLSFTQALISELKDANITITALQPGATDTDFFNKAGAQNSKIVKETKLADPEGVAKDGYEALMKGDSKVVSGLKNKVQSALSNVLPDSVLAEQMLKQSEESGK